MTFNGWGIPQENWSKLPHCFIEALPLIETLAEMKVVLYVLRHTWGYQDDEKRISIDEFVNGRKYSARYRKRHPGAGDRIDNGIGMSANSVKDGIKRAVKHGFIQVDSDDDDKARIRRYYSLNLGGQKLTPRGSKVDPLPSKVDPRTKKETIERNSETPDAPVGAVLPDGMTQSDLSGLIDFHGCDEQEAIAHWCRLNATEPPKPTEPPKLDVLTHTVQQARRREKETSWMLPGTPAGDHEYRRPFEIFCGVIQREASGVGEKRALSWLKQFETIANMPEVTVPPDILGQAVYAIRGEWGFEKKVWRDPYSDGFVGLVELTACQIMEGTHATSKGWSKPL
jgi:hypothetical protein